MSSADPYSYRIYHPPAGESLSLLPVPFPFIQRSYVHVYVDRKEVPQGELEWIADGEIRLPYGAKKEAVVRRITYEDDQLVRWEDGSYTIAFDLNLSDRQWLHLIQEHHDVFWRLQQGLPALPGPDAPTAYHGLWNRLPRYLDPDRDTPRETAQTIALPDQLEDKADGWRSSGWRSDDAHIATTAAAAERWDVIVSDTTPPIPAPGVYRQMGKLWVNGLNLKMYYWLPGQVQAWIELPLYRPGLPGGGLPGGGGKFTEVKAPLAHRVISGKDTIVFDLNILLPLGV